MKRIVTLLILAMTLVLLVCLMAAAQGATAQIIGTVKDQSGAVLPGAEVTATQTDTGATRMTVSDETGSYSLPNLPVGPYKLEVSLPGFRTFVQSGIVLQVNSSPAINAVLNVGQVAETVEVQANAAMVETRSTGIGQTVENARILELPLIGRQVSDLIPIIGAALPLTTTDTTYRGVYPNTTGFSIGWTAWRKHIHSRWWFSQRCVRQLRFAAPFSGRPSGIQGRNKFFTCSVWIPFRWRGECGDQSGNQ